VKATKKFEIPAKYADFKYEISPTELEEAKWLIGQGDFRDLDHFIECARRAQISIWMDADAEKERKAKLREKRREEAKKKKAA